MGNSQSEQRSEGGEGAAGGVEGGTRAARRERIEAMLAKAEQILRSVIAALLASEEGRQLLMAESAAQHLIVFVLSMGCFNLLALVCRTHFAGVACQYIDDFSALLRAEMFMSLLGIFLHDKLPWITYVPLLFMPLLLVRAPTGEMAAGGGEDVRARAARRERSHAMLAKAEQILSPVVASFLATHQGRKLLMSEAAAPHLIVFVLSIAGFNLLALIRRLEFTAVVTPPYIDDFSAFLRTVMFMSLIGIFVQDKLPWITYTPLLFPILLLVRALVRLYKPQGLNEENIAPEM